MSEQILSSETEKRRFKAISVAVVTGKACELGFLSDCLGSPHCWIANSLSKETCGGACSTNEFVNGQMGNAPLKTLVLKREELSAIVQ